MPLAVAISLAELVIFRYNENLHWDMRLYYKYLRNNGTTYKVIDSIKDEANEIIKRKKASKELAPEY